MATVAGSQEVLGRRALNRALLARQHLLERAGISVLAAVEHLFGMQAQSPNPPYFGLWTRVEGFQPDDLARLLLERQVVRIVLMRGTVHLVTARDCLLLRPLVQPIMDRDLRTNQTYAPHLRDLDLDEVAAAARALVEERPLTPKELGPLLQERWPECDAASLAHAARGLLPLVQVPPRGIWGKGGQPAATTAEAWLGRPLETGAGPEEMILRYLAVYGPASVMDIQNWSGLTRLGEAVEGLRPRLATFRDENGKELFDLPEAPRPDPETPAPVRFVPEYDNLLLSHADRTRIIAKEHWAPVFTINGQILGTILLDGFVAGTWKIARQRGVSTLNIRPFAPLSSADRAALTEEGGRLLTFAAPKDGHDVQFAPAAGNTDAG